MTKAFLQKLLILNKYLLNLGEFHLKKLKKQKSKLKTKTKNKNSVENSQLHRGK